jgi:site-specific DNA-methyltransferase (adenine-specific)
LEAFDAVMANFAAGTGLSKNGDGSPRNMAPDAKNPHPTVKPTELMRYLCRLLTPPGGLIVDPFAGSGSTGKAAILEGFQFIGFELDPQYTAIANARLEAARHAA